MAEEPSSDKMIRNVPERLWTRVKVVAAAEGVSIRALVIDALEQRLKGTRVPKPKG